MNPRPKLQVMINTIQNSLFLKLPPVENILNLGAADGNFIDKYPWAGCTITNLDNNSEDEVYKKYVDKENRKNVKNVFGSCTDLSQFKDKSFDMVIFSHLIEHLTSNDILKTLDEIHRVLKDTGIVLVSTPNKKIRQYFGVYKANKYHIEEYTYSELKKILEPRFKVIRQYGALWIDIDTGRLIIHKIDDPENSYVLWFICQKC